MYIKIKIEDININNENNNNNILIKKIYQIFKRLM